MKVPPGVPAEGEVFEGKYRVEGVLGIGGMGIVLAATHLYLDERVAIKVLLPELAQNPGFTERFLREGRAAVKIRSEHVARVLDVGVRGDGSPYIVMECLDGHTVSKIIGRRGPFSVPVTVDLVLQACEALAEAHALGIVHRDVKPSNLFLIARVDGTQCIKVIDFGISKASRADSIESSLTLPNTIMGSPKYMAPEQMRSSREVDARADIWALGATLHQMVTGRAPFQAETMTEIWAAVLQDAPIPLRQVLPEAPPALEAIILRCLEKTPEQRFPNIADLAFALAPLGTPAAQVSAERIARVVRPSPAGVQAPFPSAPPSAGSGPEVPASIPGQAVLPAPPAGFSPRQLRDVEGDAQASWGRRVLALVSVMAMGGIVFGVMRARHLSQVEKPSSMSTPSNPQVPDPADLANPAAQAPADSTSAVAPTPAADLLPNVREPAPEPPSTSKSGTARPARSLGQSAIRPSTRSTAVDSSAHVVAPAASSATPTPMGLAASRHE